MRKAIGIGSFGAIALAAMFVFSTVPVVGDVPCERECYKMVELTAGQTINSGYVEVWNSATTLYIRYHTNDSWYISAVQLDVESSPANFPMNKKGSPVPGHFAVNKNYDPYVQETEVFEFALIDFMAGSDGNIDWDLCLYIAAHAVVNKWDGTSYVQQQTGWGNGPRFTDKDWAMYFEYCPCEPHKILNLPDGCYNLTFSLDESDSYWDVTGGLPSALTDNYPTNYEAWCIETGQFLSSPYGGCYELISSLQVPDGFSIYNYAQAQKSVTQEQMNEINWILNYYHDNPGTYSWLDIQQAIWWIVGAIPGYVTSPAKTYTGFSDLSSNAQWLVNNADDGFLPMHGDWVAVILHNDSKQDLILEVDP